MTVTVAGPRIELDEVRSALERLSAERPFVASARYGVDRAEVRYWDEADEVAVILAQGLRMWSDHETATGLPSWRVVGLEVIDRDTARTRWKRDDHPQALVLGEIRPFEDAEYR